mmetsp:Transcript_20832/g.42815  ORF Transcript_20832/g.42815 Transcript_20832/m.42815 type:complete len:265 (+) Transcript_20832:532-1326(+)
MVRKASCAIERRAFLLPSLGRPSAEEEEGSDMRAFDLEGFWVECLVSDGGVVWRAFRSSMAFAFAVSWAAASWAAASWAAEAAAMRSASLSSKAAFFANSSSICNWTCFSLASYSAFIFSTNALTSCSAAAPLLDAPVDCPASPELCPGVAGVCSACLSSSSREAGASDVRVRWGEATWEIEFLRFSSLRALTCSSNNAIFFNDRSRSSSSSAFLSSSRRSASWRCSSAARRSSSRRSSSWRCRSSAASRSSSAFCSSSRRNCS